MIGREFEAMNHTEVIDKACEMQDRIAELEKQIEYAQYGNRQATHRIAELEEQCEKLKHEWHILHNRKTLNMNRIRILEEQLRDASVEANYIHVLEKRVQRLEAALRAIKESQERRDGECVGDGWIWNIAKQALEGEKVND